MVFGVYDFDSLRVQDIPGVDESTLRPAPTSAEELIVYASDVANAINGLTDESQTRSCQMTLNW